MILLAAGKSSQKSPFFAEKWALYNVILDFSNINNNNNCNGYNEYINPQANRR